MTTTPICHISIINEYRHFGVGWRSHEIKTEREKTTLHHKHHCTTFLTFCDMFYARNKARKKKTIPYFRGGVIDI